MSNKQLLISCLEAVSNKCLCFAIPKELCMSFFLFFLKVLKLTICIAIACPSRDSSIPRYQHFQKLFPSFFLKTEFKHFVIWFSANAAYSLIDNSNCYFMQCFFFDSLSAIALEMPQKSGSGNWHSFFPHVKCKSLTSQVWTYKDLLLPFFFFFFNNKIRP